MYKQIHEGKTSLAQKLSLGVMTENRCQNTDFHLQLQRDRGAVAHHGQLEEDAAGLYQVERAKARAGFWVGDGVVHGGRCVVGEREHRREF